MRPDFFKKVIYWGLCLWAICQPLSIACANMATGVILLGVIGHGISSRSFPSLRSTLEKPLWAYLAVGLLVSLMAMDRRESLFHFKSDIHKVSLFYLFSAAFAIESAPAALGWWAAGFSIAAVIGILQSFLWHALGPFGEREHQWCHVPHFWQWIGFSIRAHGTVNAVTYGEIMGLALIGGVCYASLRRQQGRVIGPGPMTFCTLVFLAWALTGTRAAWVGAIVGLGVLFAQMAPGKAIRALSGAVLVALLFPLAFSKLPGFWTRALDQISFTVRFEMWKTALKMFLGHPFLGVGIHNYGILFGRYHPAPLLGQPVWGDAHDLYMDQLAERGLAGIAALIFLLGTMLYQTWVHSRKNTSFLSRWNLAWLIGFLVMNLSESAFQVGMVWMPTFALYAWMERTATTTFPPSL